MLKNILKNTLGKRLNKVLVAGLAVLGSALMFTTTTYAADVQYGRLTGDHVRVRTSPTLDYDSNILFQVNRGQTLHILDVAEDFYRVNIRGYEGVYIFREFVTAFDPVAEAEEQARLELERAEEEARRAEKLAAMREYRLANAGTIIEYLLSYAKGYLGTPYRFGSTDPSRGFDCSGFVTVAMRGVDVSLQRSSRDMAANNGFRVERNELAPGDLVFFNTNGRNISHVGIYIGGNEFIHSESRRGVVITSMSDAYWRTRFVQGNRVI